MEQVAQDAEFDMGAISETLAAMLRTGGTLGKSWGTTDTEREALYQVGHSLYEVGKYSEAFKLFSMLVIQNHLEPRYLFALGGACQMLRRYSDALQYYMTAALAWLDDPRPIFHAAECLIAMGRYVEAKESLELVMVLCGDSHPTLQGRAVILMESLKSQI